MARRYDVRFEPFTPPAARFLMERTGIDFSRANFANEDLWFCASIWRDHAPVVAIAFEFKTPFDAFATVAVDDPRALSRRFLTAIFKAVFYSAARITVLVPPDNDAALGQLWRMGFRQEGFLRRGYDGERDAALYGLIPEECPYLLGAPFVLRTVKPTHEMHQGVQ